MLRLPTATGITMEELVMVGVPVVTTKIGGNPEIIEHEKNGFLVAPNDTARIEGHVRALLSDAILRARIVGAGKRTVKQFSDERMVTETIKLLTAL